MLEIPIKNQYHYSNFLLIENVIKKLIKRWNFSPIFLQLVLFIILDLKDKWKSKLKYWKTQPY